jgi:hypothetical protein
MPSSRVRSMIAMSMVFTMPITANRKKMEKRMKVTRRLNCT